MQLIPVIDLMQGHAVRARRGDRAAYRPVVSQLCEGSDPVVVAQAMCRHCAAEQLYVADLDALTGGRVQLAWLQDLLRALPAQTIWVDAGFTGPEDALRLRDRLGADAPRMVPVFGSESLPCRDALARCFAGPSAAGVLSLDRREGGRLDPAGCWELPALWPARLIVMTLERVGAGSGPDLQTLREVQALAPGRQLFGAGGIRHAADLQAAAQAGAAGWLVASALHDGRLPPVAR